MLRSIVVLAAAFVPALWACAGPAATPTSSPASSVVATASPTAAPAATATPVASAAPTATPIVIRPGESWLVFAWFPNSLYLVRPDGSDRHRLELGVKGEPFAPSWSPDGARIAFVVRDAKTPNGSIWTAAADGSGAALLYDGNGECDEGAFWPAWSPDGKRLAMVCYYVKGTTSFEAISVLDPATKVRTDVARLEGSDPVDNPVSWSPDGSTLAFEIITWDPTDSLVTGSLVATVPAAGGTLHRLTDPKLFASHPDWSPDGRLIAFNTYDTGNIHGIGKASNVYTIAPDGSGMRQLSTASTDGTMRLGQPFWSPDGTRIWVSVARDWEKDSTGQFKNTLGWVDAATGAFHEIGTEGKRFRERPIH